LLDRCFDQMRRIANTFPRDLDQTPRISNTSSNLEIFPLPQPPEESLEQALALLLKDPADDFNAMVQPPLVRNIQD